MHTDWGPLSPEEENLLIFNAVTSPGCQHNTWSPQQRTEPPKVGIMQIKTVTGPGLDNHSVAQEGPCANHSPMPAALQLECL